MFGVRVVLVSTRTDKKLSVHDFNATSYILHCVSLSLSLSLLHNSSLPSPETAMSTAPPPTESAEQLCRLCRVSQPSSSFLSHLGNRTVQSCISCRRQNKERYKERPAGVVNPERPCIVALTTEQSRALLSLLDVTVASDAHVVATLPSPAVPRKVATRSRRAALTAHQ